MFLLTADVLTLRIFPKFSWSESIAFLSFKSRCLKFFFEFKIWLNLIVFSEHWLLKRNKLVLDKRVGISCWIYFSYMLFLSCLIFLKLKFFVNLFCFNWKWLERALRIVACIGLLNTFRSAPELQTIRQCHLSSFLPQKN